MEEEEESEEESEEEESEEESEEEEVNIFNMPREQLTPAQRRLKWVKFERLPLYLQELKRKNGKEPKAKKQAKVSDDDESQASEKSEKV